MEKNIILSEITGVIAQVTTERRTCVMKEPKDYKKFFKLAPTDIPIEEMIDVLKMFQSNGYQLVLCTSRPELYREITEAWLTKAGLQDYRLLMRSTDDRRNITQVKPNLLARAGIPLSKIHMAFDGYGVMCREWRRLGVTALMTQPRVNRRIK